MILLLIVCGIVVAALVAFTVATERQDFYISEALRELDDTAGEGE